MSSLVLLIAATVFYAGYNLFIKVSGHHVPDTASTTILATIVLQLAALSTSLVFAAVLAARGTHVFSLSTPVYGWAVVAGVCIGLAEITYLYLFSGLGGTGQATHAGVAIPVVVGGTVLIAMVASVLIFKEGFHWVQIAGSALVIFGLALLFTRPDTLDP